MSNMSNLALLIEEQMQREQMPDAITLLLHEKSDMSDKPYGAYKLDTRALMEEMHKDGIQIESILLGDIQDWVRMVQDKHNKEQEG